MKSRDELQNDYEEALFAIIMDDIMELEGRALLEERKRLSESDEFKVPDDVNERCIAFINELFDNNMIIEKKRKARRIWRAFLIAALISCLCFSTVYASVPAVKRATDNFVMVLSEIRARIIFSGDGEIPAGSMYKFLYIPKDFLLSEEGAGNNCEWYCFTNDDASIYIEINYAVYNRELNVDTEDADEIINIQTGLFEGILVREEKMIRVILADEDCKNSIQVTAKNIEVEYIIKLLENIYYIQ